MVSAHRPARIRRHERFACGFPTRATSARSRRTTSRSCEPIISQLYGQQTRLHYAVPRATAPAVPVAADADTTAISRFNAQTNTANIKNPFVIPGAQEANRRPAAESGPHVRDLHRGRVQPAGPLGGHVRSGEPGKQPLQSSLYIWGFGAGKDPHRAVDRPRGAPAPSRSCRCCTSR